MLKSFQLRIARSVTGIDVREIALYLSISRTIISRWEQQLPFQEIKTKKISVESLIFFFRQHNILFPDNNTVLLNKEIDHSKNDNLTRFQLRGGRAALKLTQRKLSELVDIPVSTINYIETQDNTLFLDQTNKEIDTSRLQNFFNKNGITFPTPLSIYFSSN